MMTLNILLAFLLFAVVATSSPGPGNMLVLASSANFGFRRSVPLVLGTASGVALLLLGVGLGLGALFAAWPWLHNVLRFAGAGYLVYLAWRIARSGPVGDKPAAVSPIGFLGGAAFQWVNPKTWVVTMSAVTTYVPQSDYIANVFVVAAALGLTATVSVTLWAAFGSGLRRFLNNPTMAQWFNLTMAGALVLSVLPIVMW